MKRIALASIAALGMALAPAASRVAAKTMKRDMALVSRLVKAVGIKPE